MTRRHKGLTFKAWLAKMGAELMPLCQHEMARFRAQDTLCIAYERNRKGKQSFVPALAGQAYAAWQAGETLDLRNTIIEPQFAEPDWRTVGRAGCDVAARVNAGAEIALDDAAAEIGIHPDRMARIAAAHLLRVADGKITRAAA